MRFFAFTLAILLFQNLHAQTTADILIRNGRILDGTGNSWFWGDVAIKDGKILRIGQQLNMTANKTIDAKGLVVAPGFIDVHTHIEGDEVKNLMPKITELQITQPPLLVRLFVSTKPFANRIQHGNRRYPDSIHYPQRIALSGNDK